MSKGWTCFLYVNGRVFQTLKMKDLKPEIYVAIQTPLKLQHTFEPSEPDVINMHKMVFRLYREFRYDNTAEYRLESIK